MYREELSHQKIGTVSGIFITLGLVALILFLSFWGGFLRFIGLPWAQFVMWGAIIVLGVFIIKYMLTDYIYVVSDDRITFGRRLGRREKELLFIPLREIVKTGSYAELAPQMAKKKKFIYTFRKKKQGQVILCDGCCVIVDATDKFFEELQKRRGGK